MDLQEELKKIIKKTGDVNAKYGGYEIKVSNPDRFPWYPVFHLLIGAGQEIWIDEKEGSICITTEPRTE